MAGSSLLETKPIRGDGDRPHGSANLAVLVILLGGTAVSFAMPAQESKADSAKASYVGSEVCQACHEDIFPLGGLAGADAGRLIRHIGLAGVTFRPSQKLHFSGEVEAASSSRTYFRTSLRDYQRMHARVRYQVLGTLLLSADFSLLNNQNPLPSIRYDYLFRQISLAVNWTPQGGKRFSLQADYTRSTLRYDLSYLAPQLLAPERSFYRDNAHLSSALVDLALPGIRGSTPKLALGGSLLVSSGSRPTEYFQPLAKLLVPISNNVTWVSQWRYYGFGEGLYQFEGFRTHLITSGLRMSR